MVAVKPVYLLAGAMVAGAALWLYLPKPKAAGAAVGGAAVDAITGVFSGIGAGINEQWINPAVQGITGEADATLGGKLWDWLNPTDADALRYGLKLDGTPNYPSGGASGSW